jgi:hypothetical protein
MCPVFSPEEIEDSSAVLAGARRTAGRDAKDPEHETDRELVAVNENRHRCRKWPRVPG